MIRLYMSMSVDGFVVGPDDSMEEPMGRGGFRLFNWLDDRDSDGPSGQVYRESMATGAVIAGRRTFEHAGRWQGDHHDGVPIFILTSHPDDEPPGSAVYVLLGQGRRLFDNLPAEYIELETIRQIPARDVTHLRYRVTTKG
jgi:dihydrofolate reductase